MPGKQYNANAKIYLSIVQGTIRQSVDKETKGATRRDYELKNGQKGTKYELIFLDWYGTINDFRIKETQFGSVFEIEFKDAILQMNVDSKYFSDFAQKLPNINLQKNVLLHPFDFEPEPGKRRVGVSVEQNNEKIPSAYWDKENKKNVNNFPEVEGDTKNFDSDDWKIHFTKVKKFLKNEVERLRIEFQSANTTRESLEEAGIELLKEEDEISIIEEEKKTELIGVKKKTEVEKFDKAFNIDDEVKISDVPF